jgi:hypothetical protein
MLPFLTEILGDFISSAPERAKTKILPKSAGSRYQIVTDRVEESEAEKWDRTG